MRKKTIIKNNLFTVNDPTKADIILGDCLEILKGFDANSVDLIITSPPYADQRKKTYGGIKPDN